MGEGLKGTEERGSLVVATGRLMGVPERGIPHWKGWGKDVVKAEQRKGREEFKPRSAFGIFKESYGRFYFKYFFKDLFDYFICINVIA